jgi:hypothetical protein
MKILIKNIQTSINWPSHKMRWALLMVLLISLSASTALMAEDFQDAKRIRTKLSLTCTQLPNHQVMVVAKLLEKPDKQYVALANAAIEIYNLTDSTEVLLGKGISDKNGLVEIRINAKDQLSINMDGYYTIMGSYEGGDSYKSSDDELLFKPAIFEMEGEVIDSVNTITIKIFEDSEEALPLEDAEVVLQVPRMFSNLPIASGFTDEDGIVSFEFPNDLPGGENGELVIMAKVEDTDDYASLQGQVENNWGIPHSTTLEYHETRALWSPDAPLWMVFTFALLMILVWGHFFIIIYKLSLVHKEGKSLADKSV